MIEIIKYSDLSVEEKKLAQEKIEEIFFISSLTKSFDSIEKKQAFFNRWCGIYLKMYAQEFFLAMKEGKILGYLSGCSDSKSALELIEVTSFPVFSDLFSEFPAHLHINFHPDSRGQGLGSLLVNHYKDYLKSNDVKGVHLVTSPDASNVSFYERLNFTSTHQRSFKEVPLYFMGCFLR